jgi:hypothetical protein
MRPPNDLPPATRASSGSKPNASATAARTVELAVWSEKFAFEFSAEFPTSLAKFGFQRKFRA